MSNEHIERMKSEYKELGVKIDALNSFIHSNPIFKTLCYLEQVRMIKQVGHMESYLQILDARIWTANDKQIN
tara:strand:- start:318 stop:533 length:216 start_codon:yes stop_codon:yes gene_type:complete